MAVQTSETSYYLHTRQTTPQQFDKEPPSNFNSSKLTKIIIHGYRQSSKRQWYRQMTNEYLKRGDFNIVQVDWASLASGSYFTAARNTAIVGANLGELVANLRQNSVKVHLIGHSLGAHVAGHAGRRVFKSLGNSRVGRITGLDPAGPLFESPRLLRGLTRTDAEIVDVIHTDGGMFGCKNPLGTVDFYPNGGVRHQPGCSPSDLRTELRSLHDIVFCSHEKSYGYFIESINNRVFEGRKCNSWLRRNCSGVVAVMGEGYVRKPDLLGVFYLNTTQF
ncbi:pancreatic triacylglycerol lipase-like [Photinus pyralis]|nr:pancreatic triacylglycerol lipase-like [Photinus pyralis]